MFAWVPIIAALLCTACGTGAVPLGQDAHATPGGATPAGGDRAATAGSSSGTLKPTPPSGHGAAVPTTAAGASPLHGPSVSSAGITVTLAYACVQPGGQQLVRIEVPQQASVAYNTWYADQKSGTDYGGEAVGVTDSRGAYESGWTVSVHAPVGRATVRAGARYANTTSVAADVAFNVSTHC